VHAAELLDDLAAELLDDVTTFALQV